MCYNLLMAQSVQRPVQESNFFEKIFRVALVLSLISLVLAGLFYVWALNEHETDSDLIPALIAIASLYAGIVLGIIFMPLLWLSQVVRHSKIEQFDKIYYAIFLLILVTGFLIINFKT